MGGQRRGHMRGSVGEELLEDTNQHRCDTKMWAAQPTERRGLLNPYAFHPLYREDQQGHRCS